MHNPFDIERRFQSLISILASPSSARRRLFEIHQFLDWLGDDFSQHESYLLELAQHLPGLTKTLNAAGTPPEPLHALAEKLRRLLEQVPALRTISELTAAIDRLTFCAAGSYAYAGDLRSSMALLDERFAASIPSWFAEPANGHRRQARALLQHARQLAAVHDAAISTALDTLMVKCFPAPAKEMDEVVVPVIERALLRTQSESPEGAVRRLSCRILGDAANGEDELDADVRVLGASAGASFLRAPIAAARGLLAGTHPHLAVKHFSGKISFDQADAWHEGNSANLAIAALFYCAILRHADQRLQFRLAENVAITGEVNEHGEVLPVDQETLAAKVKAVFFAWVECLVVPMQQLQEAEAAANALTEKYPRRQLTIIGVRQLQEIFYDRRLAVLQRAGLVKFAARRAWRKKFTVGGLATIGVLTLMIAKLLYGPIDHHPAAGEFVEETLLVKNKYGEVIDEIWVGKITVDGARAALGSPWAAFIDLDKDGFNEVIWLQNRIEQTGYTAFVSCKSISKDSVLWRVPLQRQLDFPRKPDVRSDKFIPGDLAAGDFDGDGSPEVFVLANHDYFPALILKLKAVDGRELGHYVHIGALQQMRFADLDGDGKSEVLLCGVNNAFRMACLLVLDSRLVAGRSPWQGDYELAGYPPGLERAYVLFPRTIVGQVFQYVMKFNIARWMVIEESGRRFHVVVREKIGANEFPGGVDGVELSYYFNFNFVCQSIGTNDDYDLLAEKLFNEGRIGVLPNYEYFEAHKRTLLYWNGEAWQNSVALNKQYLEASEAK